SPVEHCKDAVYPEHPAAQGAGCIAEQSIRSGWHRLKSFFNIGGPVARLKKRDYCCPLASEHLCDVRLRTYGSTILKVIIRPGPSPTELPVKSSDVDRHLKTSKELWDHV